MRGGARRAVTMLGLLLGCGPTPTEVMAPLGTTGASTSAGSTSMASTHGSSSAEGSNADASGGATGDGTTTSAEGGATQGLQDDTSTGEIASTGETASTGASGPGTSTSDGGESSSSTGAPASCQDLYGLAPGYELCMETPDECHFAALTNGDDCNAMCSAYGGTCIDAFDNSSGCTIIPPDTDDCTTDRGSEICVCSR